LNAAADEKIFRGDALLKTKSVGKQRSNSAQKMIREEDVNDDVIRNQKHLVARTSETS
jgi:hypothetical protein